jgi:hypothetical protein
MTGTADVDLAAEVAAVEMEHERADVAPDVEHGRPAHRRGVRVVVPVVMAVIMAVIENGAHTASGRTS